MQSWWQMTAARNTPQQSPIGARPMSTAGGGNTGNAMAGAGMAMAIGGMVVQAIGGYYAARSAKLQARSAALSLEFQGSMADINARNAELDAQAIRRAGQWEAARLSMESGAMIASGRVSQAAAGLQAGVGSAGEVAASAEMMKRLDAYAVNLNAVRQANAARARSVDFQNQGLLSRTAAANTRRMGGAISTFASTTIGLLSGAGSASGAIGSYYGRN